MGITEEQARTRAAKLGHPLSAEAEVRETERWWYFPVESTSCAGVVVDKAEGRATPLGKQGRLEDWLWGYDAGLLEEGNLAIVVTEVFDVPRAIDAFARIGLRVSQTALRHLPLRLDAHGVVQRLREARAIDGSIARWHVEGPRGVVRRVSHGSIPPPAAQWDDEATRACLADLAAWFVRAPDAKEMGLAVAPSCTADLGGATVLHRSELFAQRDHADRHGAVTVVEAIVHNEHALLVFEATDTETGHRHRFHWIARFAAPCVLGRLTSFSTRV